MRGEHYWHFALTFGRHQPPSMPTENFAKENAKFSVDAAEIAVSDQRYFGFVTPHALLYEFVMFLFREVHEVKDFFSRKARFAITGRDAFGHNPDFVFPHNAVGQAFAFPYFHRYSSAV